MQQKKKDINSVGQKTEEAIFGGGCFWGVEHVFRRTKGVLETECGYMGGSQPNPSYEDVCTDTTGHAEIVRVFFDPDTLTYESLLEVFFDSHNPTTFCRQGADVGTQYRSIIFYGNENQEKTARAKIEQLQKMQRYPNPIVTHLCPKKQFYRAEEYHQRYFEKNPSGVCCVKR